MVTQQPTEPNVLLPKVLTAQHCRPRYDDSVRQFQRHEVQGVNSRLDELQAAFLRVKLPHLDEWNARRGQLAARYADALADVPHLSLPPPPYREPVMPGTCSSSTTLDATTCGWPWLSGASGLRSTTPNPPHLSPAYRSLGYGSGAFPVAERSSATNLALPLSPHLTDDAHAAVIGAVRAAVIGAVREVANRLATE